MNLIRLLLGIAAAGGLVYVLLMIIQDLSSSRNKWVALASRHYERLVGVIVVLLLFYHFVTPPPPVSKGLMEEFAKPVGLVPDINFAQIDLLAPFGVVQQGLADNGLGAAPPEGTNPFDKSQVTEVAMDGSYRNFKYKEMVIAIPGGYYQDDAQIIELAARIGQAYDYLEQRTGFRFSGYFEVIIKNRQCGTYAGVAETENRKVYFSVCPQVDARIILQYTVHEMAHQLLDDHFANHFNAGMIMGEGMATWAAGEYWLNGRSSFKEYVIAEYGDKLLTITHPAYGQGADIWDQMYYQWAALCEYIVATNGVEKLHELYDAGQSNGWDFAEAPYQSVLGKSYAELEAEWLAWLKQ